MNDKSRERLFPLCLLLLAVPGLAQPAEGDEKLPEIDEIIVTGTFIRGIDPVGSEPVSIDRNSAQLTGLSNASDVLRRLPQISIGADVGQQGGTANQGYNQAQTESINLRGLGPAATLVLIDGRRLVGSGAIGTSIEANRIPMPALQRIEVLPDGASALYGSDAVAGVVNYVTRSDLDGTEISLRTGNQSGGQDFSGNVTTGARWDSWGDFGPGNVIFTYDRQKRDAYRAGKNSRLRQDLRPMGGPDLRINGDDASVGFSPNVIAVQGGSTIPGSQIYTYWGVPQGNGNITDSDLRVNDPNLSDAADYTDYIGEQLREQYGIFFNQAITPAVELFGSFDFTDRETSSLSAAPTTRISLAGTPYEISGLPADQMVQYSTLKDGQLRRFDAYSDTLGAVLGARFDLGGDWEGEAYYNFGRNEQCDSCVSGGLNPAALTAQVQSGQINPLSSEPLTATQMQAVYGGSKFESRTTLENWVAKFNGPLFDTQAGEIRAAVAMEYRSESNANRNTSKSGSNNETTVISGYAGTRYDRNVESVAGELYIPLINSAMGVPFVESLEFSAALRYDNYSDVGSTTNPRIGFTWHINDEFKLAGTWGQSFRAPSVTDVNKNALTSGSKLAVPNSDPRIQNFAPGFPFTNAAIFLGSNPDLFPETSDNWSLSAAFERDDFKLSTTYWSIRYEDQIAFPGTINAYVAATPDDVPTNGGNYNGWGEYIIPVNNPSSCDNSDITTADPVLQAYLESLNYDFIGSGGDFSGVSSLASSFCDVRVILDSRVQNVASVVQAGIDIAGSYFADIAGVSTITTFGASHIVKNDVSSAPRVAAERQIGNLSDATPRWRGIATTTAIWNGIDTTLSVRYMHKMSADSRLNPDGSGSTLSDKTIGAHTELDLTVGYTKEFMSSNSELDSWRVQLAVTNIDNNYPDFVANGGGSASLGWSPIYGLPFGRTYSVELSLKF